MRIGIVVPMKAEFLALGASRVRPGAIERLSSGVLAALSGVGPERARNTARRLLDEGATALMSWGCAAALRPDLRAGSLLLPATVVSAAGAFEADPEWHRVLCERMSGLETHTEPIVESALLQDRAAKASLAAATGALAADMESAAIAAIARDARVPFAALRAVSDAADLGVPQALAAGVTADGEIARLRTFFALAVAPAHWITALRLARGFRAAQLTLREAAIRAELHSGAEYRQMFVPAKS
jgi:adenosylhomocysteine nucleosidase